MRLTLWICSLLLIVTIGFVTVGQVLADSEEDRYDSLKRFSQVLEIVETYYVRDVSRKELVDGAVQGMLQKLDPHSAYMDRDEFEEMHVSTSGEFSGIGIEISMKNGRLTVVAPIEDTPAYRSGLLSGDIILEIDGESTQDITLMDAVKKIRGPKGSEVVLTVLHKGTQSPERIGITRDTIPIISVKNDLLEPGYGYLRLTRFNERTTEELYEALDEMAEDTELKGLVLDLRDNPGGLLDQAVNVADAFLRDGKIVYIMGKTSSSRRDFLATDQRNDVGCSLVVLVNAGSASASEIVAGALQDHRRALIIGETTFGKGSVQTIIPLSDGAGIKLTTALYYTPNGRSIQASGIEPDMLIPLALPEDDAFALLRESDLSGHLENGENGDDASGYDNSVSERVIEMLETDNQLRIALQFLKDMPEGYVAQ